MGSLLPLIIGGVALLSLIFGIMKFLVNRGEDRALAGIRKEKIETLKKRESDAQQVEILKEEKLKKPKEPCAADPFSRECAAAGMEATNVGK